MVDSVASGAASCIGRKQLPVKLFDSEACTSMKWNSELGSEILTDIDKEMPGGQFGVQDEFIYMQHDKNSYQGVKENFWLTYKKSKPNDLASIHRAL